MSPPSRASRAVIAFTLAGALITAAPSAQQTLPSGAGHYTFSVDGARVSINSTSFLVRSTAADARQIQIGARHVF